MPAPSRHGFTLVELSLVLVIIGLIVGGVLVGRDLIEAGKIRAQISQISDIETQINTFRVKYDCLPGDCPTATSALGATVGGNTIVNGDGNGVIHSTTGAGTTYPEGECLLPSVQEEITQLFVQITAAGLGKYNTKSAAPAWNSTVGTEATRTAYGNETNVFVSCLGSTTPSYVIRVPALLRNGNIMLIGTASFFNQRIGNLTSVFQNVAVEEYGEYSPGLYYNPIGIPADAIRQIDEKIDDGKPSSGKFGIVAGDTDCAFNTTAYPSPNVYCRATAGKKMD